MALRVIYLDELLLVNFIIDYLALCVSAVLFGKAVRTARLLAASGIGAVYSVASSILPVLTSWPIAMFFACLMVVIAFGIKENIFVHVLVFLFASAMFAGAATAASRSLDYTANHSKEKISIRGLITAACICYIAIRIFMHRFLLKTVQDQEIDIKIVRCDRTAHITAIRDTGNRLRDPMTGRGVIVVSAAAAKLILPQHIASVIANAGQRSADDLLTELSKSDECERFGLVPFNSVGKSGLMLTYRPDRIEEQGQIAESSLIAFSPNPISIIGKPDVCAIVN